MPRPIELIGNAARAHCREAGGKGLGQSSLVSTQQFLERFAFEAGEFLENLPGVLAHPGRSAAKLGRRSGKA